MSRKEIRDAVYTQLLNATDAGERIYKTRVIPYSPDMDLPAIAVYTMDEAVGAESRNTAPRELERELEVVIEGLVAIVEGKDGLYTDDYLDTIADQIETAMHKDPYFGDKAGDSILSGTEIEILEVGDRLVGMVKLTYSFTYRTLAPVEPTLTDDFLRVEAKYRPTSVAEPEQAEDEFNVRAP